MTGGNGTGWRSVFLINVPVGAAALALATLGLTALVLPLVEGRQPGWPASTWASGAELRVVRPSHLATAVLVATE